MRPRRLLFLAALIALSSTLDETNPERRPYIAFSRDFSGFASWPSWAPSFGVMGNDHLNGPRRIYFSRRPVRGIFPVGTIIVKESRINREKSARQLFAMVKRGGGFNADGAKGWEWFELENLDGDADAVRIMWRGTGPTNGDAYGGDPTGGCNACHESAVQFDYVYSMQVEELSHGRGWVK